MIRNKHIAALMVAPVLLVVTALPAGAAPMARCTKVAPRTHDAYARCVAMSARAQMPAKMVWTSRLARSAPRTPW